jgi:hypothetical protein
MRGCRARALIDIVSVYQEERRGLAFGAVRQHPSHEALPVLELRSFVWEQIQLVELVVHVDPA